MPRRTRKLTAEGSRIFTVRVPNDLADAAETAAGGSDNLSEWLRNVIRVGVGRKLDRNAGYAEGKAQGWREANERFRAALKMTGEP